MNFEFNETQRMIRETARQFAHDELAATAESRDEKEEFPYEAVKKLGELGFMGMMVPEQYGGAGLDTVSYSLAVEEISRVDASCGVIMSVNNSLVCYGLNEFGNEEQKQKFLITPRVREKARRVCTFGTGSRKRCYEPADDGSPGRRLLYS